MNRIKTLAAAFDAYRAHALLDASPQTINQFRVSLKHFAEAVGTAAPSVADLTNENVSRVLMGLRTSAERTCSRSGVFSAGAAC